MDELLLLTAIVILSVLVNAILMLGISKMIELETYQVAISQLIVTMLFIYLAGIMVADEPPAPDCNKYEYGSQSRLMCQVDWLYYMKGGD